MTKKKKGILPSLEILIILVFLACFIMWAISKCDETKQLYEEEAIEEAEPIASPSAIPERKPKKPPTPPTKPADTQPAPLALPPTTSTPAAPPTASPSFTKLYITVDSLNMRKAPSLDSLVLAKLRLFEEVIYLNETTEWRQKIKLAANDIANEPWIKIRNRQGNIGWIYGAGVHFYKQRRIPNTPAPPVQPPAVSQ